MADGVVLAPQARRVPPGPTDECVNKAKRRRRHDGGDQRAEGGRATEKRELRRQNPGVDEGQSSGKVKRPNRQEEKGGGRVPCLRRFGPFRHSCLSLRFAGAVSMWRGVLAGAENPHGHRHDCVGRPAIAAGPITTTGGPPARPAVGAPAWVRFCRHALFVHPVTTACGAAPIRPGEKS